MIILVMPETGKLSAGLDPGGATGIQARELASLDSSRVPSCFL